MVLSIIIPIYNVEKYIKNCLNSIYTQSVDENLYEIILVNDGSPDKSMEICNEFISSYSNIQVIEQTNQGLSCARNNGMKFSTGEYLWFVDSDDMILNSSLQTIINTISGNECDCLLLGHREENEKGKVLMTHTYENKAQMNGNAFLYDYFNYCAYFIPVQFTIWNKEFLEKHNLVFHKGIYHEDCEFTIKAFVNAIHISFLAGEQYLYLRHNNTISTTANPKRSFDYLKIIDELNKIGITHHVVFDYMGLFFVNALKNIIKCNLKDMFLFFRNITMYKKGISNLRYSKIHKYKVIGLLTQLFF